MRVIEKDTHYMRVIEREGVAQAQREALRQGGAGVKGMGKGGDKRMVKGGWDKWMGREGGGG